MIAARDKKDQQLMSSPPSPVHTLEEACVVPSEIPQTTKLSVSGALVVLFVKSEGLAADTVHAHGVQHLSPWPLSSRTWCVSQVDPSLNHTDLCRTTRHRHATIVLLCPNNLTSAALRPCQPRQSVQNRFIPWSPWSHPGQL